MVIDIVHVRFVHILISQFLTDILVNLIIFEVCNLSVHLGMLSAHVSCDGWHL